MPNSSNPLNVVSAALVIFCGVTVGPLGVVGFFAETGTMRLVWGAAGLAGIVLIWGGIGMIRSWHKATKRETEHQAALQAAAHAEASPTPRQRGHAQTRSSSSCSSL